MLKLSAARREKEYQQESPTPDKYNAFRDQIRQMQETQPSFTAEQLRSIRVPTWIVNGDHEEVIKRKNTLFMADQFRVQSCSFSHFALLQDPEQSDSDLLHFLQQAKVQR